MPVDELKIDRAFVMGIVPAGAYRKAGAATVTRLDKKERT
jgi:hypothetical protein